MSNQASRPQIFAHHDHLSFLRAWIEHLKASRKGFSLRKLAKDSGLATGYLPMVLSGQRKLTEKALAKLIPALGLTKSEVEVFRLLIIVGESESAEERMQALERIQRYRGYKDSHSKEIEVYKYLTQWTFVAIREMALLKGFQADVAWIQSRLKEKVSSQEIRTALDFLFENGYLVKGPKGAVRVTEKDLICEEGVYKISLGQFHREMLRLAGNSIDTTARNQRSILGHTAAIQAKDLEQVRAILNEALAKIQRLTARSEEGEAVYHVELAAFPLTDIDDGTSER